MYTQAQRQTEYAHLLQMVVENGRIVGDTPDERQDSAVEEVLFELAEAGLADYAKEATAFVQRHYVDSAGA